GRGGVAGAVGGGWREYAEPWVSAVCVAGGVGGGCREYAEPWVSPVCVAGTRHPATAGPAWLDASAAWLDAPAGARCSTGAAGQQLVERAGVDDPVGAEARLRRAIGTVRLPLQLPRGVRIGVDGELAPHVDGDLEEAHRRVEPFGPAVDLHRGAELLA